jgi:hypothetical protein
MFHGMFVKTFYTFEIFTICFTICLFISPDLDGHMFHDMFVHMFHDMFL